MTEATRTLIYPLHYDRDTSARIGYLCSQERQAYNVACNALNRTPGMPLHSIKWHTGMVQTIYTWRREDPRADAHRSIHLSGACQAWTDNRLMMLRRNQAVLNAARGHAVSSRLGSHPRRLRLRSRKHGTSTLSCLEPPVRLDERTFTIPGATDVILKTKRPVPTDIDIRSFRLVEVRRHRRGVNGRLDRRRYALHLQVVVNDLPEPPSHGEIVSPADILGLGLDERDNRDKEFLAASNGETIRRERSEAQPAERVTLARSSRKKRGSKRRVKLLKKTRRLAGKRRANDRRLVRQGAARLLASSRPKAAALGRLPSPDDSLTGKLRKKRSASPAYDTFSEASRSIRKSSLNWRQRIVAEEAAKRGIRTYHVLPLPEDGKVTCGGCGRRRRVGGESQASHRCRGCGYEADTNVNAARVLANRAFLMACLASGRELTTESTSEGWRVRPPRGERDWSRSPHGVDKPKDDEERQTETLPNARGDRLRGASSEARSPEQDAQRQLMDDPIHKHAITFLEKLPIETVALLQLMVYKDAAESTKRWYISAMANWAAWAMANGCPVVPARVSHLALYFVVRVSEGYNPRSMRSYSSAINAYHRALGLPEPVTPSLRRVLQGLMNKYGASLKQARGLTAEHLKALRAAPVRPQPNMSMEEAQQRKMVDIAIISLMRDALLRRSEAAALFWTDIEEVPDGIGLVTVRRSKTDPYGEGAVLPFSRKTMNDLKGIRGSAGPDDSVFGFTQQSIHNRIRAAMKAAGFGNAFGGHSPRRGMAQDLLNAGATPQELMEAGRWKTLERALDYALGAPPDMGAEARYHRRRTERNHDAGGGLR